MHDLHMCFITGASTSTPTQPEPLLFAAGIEIVSPVLQGLDGLAQIYRLQSTLSTLPVSFNTSTGLHIHVGYKPGAWPFQQLRAISLMFCDLEAGFDQLVPADRRGSANRFCASLVLPNPKEQEGYDPHNPSTWSTARATAASAAAAASCPASKKGPQCPPADASVDVRAAACAACSERELANAVNAVDRRYKLNFRALEKHKTLEFRHPAATGSAEEICGFAVMYLLLVAAGAEHKACCGGEHAKAGECDGSGHSKPKSDSGGKGDGAPAAAMQAGPSFGVSQPSCSTQATSTTHVFSSRLQLGHLSQPRPTSLSQLPPDLAGRLSSLPPEAALELAPLAITYQSYPCMVSAFGACCVLCFKSGFQCAADQRGCRTFAHVGLHTLKCAHNLMSTHTCLDYHWSKCHAHCPYLPLFCSAHTTFSTCSSSHTTGRVDGPTGSEDAANNTTTRSCTWGHPTPTTEHSTTFPLAWFMRSPL